MASTTDSEAHNLESLLSSEERDFLVRNNGDQVTISNLVGKTVGLYFSGSWCGPCRGFTPKLVEVYEELSSKGDFEVVFISSDRANEAFDQYFAKMPWLSIPFSDSGSIKRLKDLFKVRGIPCLVIIDSNGKVSTDKGVSIIRDFGSEAYPFTPERIHDLREEEEAAKKQQTLRSILISSSRDFVISNTGTEIPVSELEGKVIGLYFVVDDHRRCTEFTTKLVEVYRKIKDKGENFEVVLVWLDDEEEESFKQSFDAMPWLALPFKDKSCEKLARYFELRALPTLTIIGPDGKTLHPNVAELVEEHGVEAYPFSPEKVAELAEIEKARLEAQTLESILVSGDTDFVIEKSGSKVPVSELVGKNILLYFSAEWCPPCRAFLPKFIEIYHEIKAKDGGFEVIFISSDRNQPAFDEFFSGMPWLALPFGDDRKAFLQRRFKIGGIPAVVAIGPSGRTLTTQAKQLLQVHGADAYPFTEDHLKKQEQKQEQKLEEMSKGWPEKVKTELHPEHELTLTRRSAFICNGCREIGHAWSFLCKQCDFDLHPKCALKQDEATKNGPKEGWSCEGDVCKKS
ncbi:probable nucleoredoxin 1 isoform X5 [Diospyros lotus]|uniref:probable nucleoredoxin 1 isoform X3 n=1 Tax=Diospyros lotus TaxID=55363 RepID=UPI00225710C8|nr:probable nucleoredoxin 1 isoform X3 [Diospyros lotus]XP_052204588.1 probable nucleoredoxin 1 isoform X5 [Diospyros lotus]